MQALSKQLNFRVNDYPIILGEELKNHELAEHKFKKTELLGRLIVKPKSNEIIWWAKNCGLKYLADGPLPDNSIFPILDVKSGPQMMYGTSAYLWYEQNKLTKFVFQIIQNKMAAEVNLENIEKKLIKTIGTPLINSRPFITWETGDQKLILEYPKNDHGYIHLMCLE